MSKLNALLLAAFALTMLASPVTQASGKTAIELDIQAQSFSAQAARIRADLAGGGKYAEIKPEDRRTVLSLLDRIKSQLGPDERVDELPQQATIDIFNDQEQINGILTGLQTDNRLICRREQVTGSHRRQQRCISNTIRDSQRKADQEALQHYRQTRTLSLEP